jgi:hypothetical protein
MQIKFPGGTMNLNSTMKLLTTMIVFLLICCQISFAEKNDQDEKDPLAMKAEEKYISQGDSERIYRYYSNTVIEEGEVINGHIIVEKGDLSIRGKVNGDVLVLWGNARVYNSGMVKGNITSIDGTVDVYDNGRVGGEMLETSVNGLITKNRQANRLFRKSLRKDRYGTIPLANNSDDLILKVNRVDGTFLGLRFPKQYISDFGHFNSYGFLGYGFESKDVRFQFGLDRWFFDPLYHRFEIGGEVHSLTDTKDLWRMPYFENTLAALFFKEDFFDYFGREGFSLHVSQYITPLFRGRVEFRNDDYSSLSTNTNWAIFGRGKDFRMNPALGVYEGNMRSVYGELYYDSRDDLDFTTTGWFGKASAEVSSDALGSGFNFNRYLVDLRHYLPLTTGENVNFRVMLGTSEGDLPLQKNFELGGISTLRAFNYKEFSGNSMFLFNLEYRIHSHVLGSEIPFLEDFFSIILFSDFGEAWSSPQNSTIQEKMEGLRLKDLKTDVGFAIADPDGDYRLNIAKRTDSGENDFVLTFRISQPF